MAVDWPATLPEAPASYSQQKKPSTIFTEPDSGPSKSRRRFTKGKTTAQMSFLLTIAQRNALDTFYTTDLKEGSIPMNFVHPWTGVSKQMFIKEPPKEESDGPLGVQVSFPVEFY